MRTGSCNEIAIAAPLASGASLALTSTPIAGIKMPGDETFERKKSTFIADSEVLSPSPAIPALIDNSVRPKAQLLLGIVGEVLSLPPDHPAVQRGLMFSILPWIALMIAPKQMSVRTVHRDKA